MMRALPVLLLASCGYITEDEYAHRVGGGPNASDLQEGAWDDVAVPSSAGASIVRATGTPTGDVILIWNEPSDGQVKMARVDDEAETGVIADGITVSQLDAAISPDGVALGWVRVGNTEMFVQSTVFDPDDPAGAAARVVDIDSVDVTGSVENLNIVVRRPGSERTLIYDQGWVAIHQSEMTPDQFESNTVEDDLGFSRELDADYDQGTGLVVLAADPEAVVLRIYGATPSETELFVGETANHLQTAPRVKVSPDGVIHAAWLSYELYTDKEYAELWYANNANGDFESMLVDNAVGYADRIGLALGPDGPRVCYPHGWYPVTIFAELSGGIWTREVVTPDGRGGGDCEVVSRVGGGLSVIYSDFSDGITVSRR